LKWVPKAGGHRGITRRVRRCGTRPSHRGLRSRVWIARSQAFISRLPFVPQSRSTAFLMLNVDACIFLPITETTGARTLSCNHKVSMCQTKIWTKRCNSRVLASSTHRKTRLQIASFGGLAVTTRNCALETATGQPAILNDGKLRCHDSSPPTRAGILPFETASFS